MASKEQMKGRELAEDLARTLQLSGSITWTQMPLGSVQMSNPGIADVLAMDKSFTNPNVRIYEVKISRNDFQRDVHSMKYARYLNSCHRLMFATPKGLVTRDEVPKGCGLITYSAEKGWHTQKAATKHPCELSEEMLIALIIRGNQDFWQKPRDLHKDSESWWEYTGLQQAAYRYGKEYAKDLARSKNLIEEAEKLKAEIEKVLGREITYFGGAVLGLDNAIRQKLNKYRYVEELAALAEVAHKLFRGTSWGVVKSLDDLVGRFRMFEEIEKSGQEEIADHYEKGT